MICRRCGTENDKNNQFCGRCGIELASFVDEQSPVESRPCYRHPKELTVLSCGRCERPVCTRCVIMGPAGPRCPDCGRQNVRISARGVAHDLTAGFRRFFWGGPMATYGWILLAILAFSLFRSCSGPRTVIIQTPPDQSGISTELPD
ncbi:MAG: zinc-ribbon domain-containing protein [Methanoregulaceae archaeon]|nr:zinc-ribbon domain-containing protein [Methanoregulaceae archaeon]